jgi:hypothetical protein
MYTLKSEAAKADRGVSRKSLIKDQPHTQTNQAALLSVALSSRLAAATPAPAEHRPAQALDGSGKGLPGSDMPAPRLPHLL